MARWSEDSTMKFVEKYIKHDCLWDIRDASYKNKQKREAAYFAIANVMGIEGFQQKDVAQKIKNIRSTFSQELRKIKASIKSGAGIDDVYTPNVKWFTLLEVKLKPIEEATRQMKTNLGVESQDTAKLTWSSDQLNDTITTAKTAAPPEKTPRNIKRLQELTSVLHQIKELPSVEPSESEWDIFGPHVTAQMKSLPVSLALQAQQHINNYLINVRLSQYRQSNVDQQGNLYCNPSPQQSSSYSHSDQDVNVTLSNSNSTFTSNIYSEPASHVVTQESDILTQAIRSIHEFEN